MAVNAAFGVAAQVYNAMNTFLINFQTAFKPQLVQSYAAGELDAHYKLVSRSARMYYFLLLLFVVPVAFNLNGLLGLWLMEVPHYIVEFCFIILLAYLVDALGAPLAVSVFANGNIKGMQVWKATLPMLSLVACFVFLRSGASPYIVAIIIFHVHFGFWCVYMYYAHKLSQIGLRGYAKQVVLPVVLVSVGAVVVPVLLSFVSVSRWIVLLVCAADLVWVGAVILLVGLRKEEKAYLKELVFSKMKK